MFNEHNIAPGTFNAICAPITQMRTQKSDHENGYYIVAGLWGTCFHRISTKRDRFEIVGNNNPKCPHTYTKIPAALADKTFFVYVNYREGFKINLPRGGIVVGLHEAQPHKSGGWWSQSALIYSPTGEAPTVEETETSNDAKQICIVDRRKETLLTVEKIMQSFEVRFIAVNEDGFYVAKSTRPDRKRNFPFVRSTTRIGDLFG